MFNTRLVVFALVLVPAMLSAQGSGRSKDRGTKAPDWDKEIKNSSGPQLSLKDVENMSPIKLLIEKRKDLKLSDEQTSKFKELDTKQKETNKELMSTLDSLRKEMKPRTSTPDDLDMARMQIVRESVLGVLKTVRVNYTATLNAALPQLDDAQKKSAQELLQTQEKESEEMLREKLGGGGRRGGR